MKCNPWTMALVGAGLVSLPAVTQAEEKPSSVMTALSSTTLSGYVDTSAQWNFGTGNANLPPYAFGGSSKADGFNLNVVRLVLEKPTDAADAWSAGYKADLLFGPDANTLATQSNLAAGAGDFAIKQAYVALHAPVGNGLDFKMGVFDSPMGYEVFPSGDNPNFTRSYGYTLEPTTLTGLIATYNFNEMFSLSAAVANTFGPTINGRASDPYQNSNGASQAESFKTYVGALTFTAPTNSGFLAGSTLNFCVINGYNQNAGTTAVGSNPGGIGNNQTSWYAGATVNTPVTGLKAGVAFDQVVVHDSSGDTWCIGGYLNYQATEKLSFNGRGEYVSDSGAQKFFATRAADGDILSDTAPNKFMEFTLTAQYDLWKNVISRLEVRWDHSLSGTGVWGGTVSNSQEGGNGTLINQVMLAANIIYKF